jgi:hypothetical protein
MRAFCMTFLITPIAFLAFHTTCTARCEALNFMNRARRESNWMIDEGWKHSHFKYLDIMAAAPWAGRERGPDDRELTNRTVKELLAHLRAMNANQAPSFIVEPAIWYFDSDSHVHKMNFDWWQTPINDVLVALNANVGSTPRRTFPKTWFERFERDRSVRGFPDVDGSAGGSAFSSFK